MKNEIHEQTRDGKFCEEHDLVKMRNAMGQFVCPFCQGDY